MKLVYVAGPYNAPTDWERENNIWHARSAGAQVVMHGAYPVIPHANTAHFGGLADEELFYAGSMALLEACHGILLLNGWNVSKGAQSEFARAVELGQLVFQEVLPSDWLAMKEWAQS